jgi:hypothetical protein
MNSLQHRCNGAAAPTPDTVRLRELHYAQLRFQCGKHERLLGPKAIRKNSGIWAWLVIFSNFLISEHTID